jgi:hypothetical protein
LLYPIGVDFNAVTMSFYAAKQVSECHSIADAGIDRRKCLRENQPIPQSFGLGYWKREKAELRLAMGTHG